MKNEKNPLTLGEALSLDDETESLLAGLFYAYNLDRLFYIFHERRRLVDPKTHVKTLPDFEIIPICPQNFLMSCGFVETARTKISRPHKNDQRQAAMSWMSQNPNTFRLEYTHAVLENCPHLVYAILNVFTGEIKPGKVQDQISDAIYRNKHVYYLKTSNEPAIKRY